MGLPEYGRLQTNMTIRDINVCKRALLMGAVVCWSALALQAMPPKEVPESENSLLWEISGNGLEEVSYLYGTIHVRDSRAFRFGDSVMTALDRCEAIVLELLPDDLRQSGMDMDLYLRDSSLHDLLAPADAQLLDSLLLARSGIGLEAVKKLKPIFVAVTLSTGSLRQDRAVTVDEFLYAEARKRDIRGIALEEVEEQLDALATMSLQQQAETLMETARNIDKYDSLINQMVESYAAGDLLELSRVLDEASAQLEDSVFMNALFSERNTVMTERVAALVHKQPSFVAVGAGHLPGEEGLLQLLRAEGFHVRPILATYQLEPPPTPPQTSYTEFRSEEGRFVIRTPDRPIEQLQSVPTPDGEMIDVHIFATTDIAQGLSFLLTYSDIPGMQTNTRQRLEASVQKALDALGATVVQSEFVQQGDRSVIEFRGEFTGGGGSLRGRSVASDGRLYQLMAINPTASVDTAGVTDFFGSFRILPKK